MQGVAEDAGRTAFPPRPRSGVYASDLHRHSSPRSRPARRYSGAPSDLHRPRAQERPIRNQSEETPLVVSRVRWKCFDREFEGGGSAGRYATLCKSPVQAHLFAAILCIWSSCSTRLYSSR